MSPLVGFHGSARFGSNYKSLYFAVKNKSNSTASSGFSHCFDVHVMAQGWHGHILAIFDTSRIFLYPLQKNEVNRDSN